MLQSRRQLPEALAYLQQHEALAPGDHHALVQQGRVLADLGRFAEAEAVLRRAVVVRDATAEFNLGTVLDQQGRWDEARGHYERALAIDPFNTQRDEQPGRRPRPARRDGGRARALRAGDRHRPDQAEFYVELRQRAHPGSGVSTRRCARWPSPSRSIREPPNAHNNLGIALAQQQMLLPAREAFERALQIDPAHVNARRNLELTLRVLPEPAGPELRATAADRL